MPRKHKVPHDDCETPKPKRQKLTDAQLERKRELDREAQRTIRERTKNRMAYLEGLVKVLQGDQDGRVERLVAQLNESKAEVNRLKDALNNIARITGAVITFPPSVPQESASTAHIKDDSTSPANAVLETAAIYHDDESQEAGNENEQCPVRRTSSDNDPIIPKSTQSAEEAGPNKIPFPKRSSIVELNSTNYTPEVSPAAEGEVETIDDLYPPVSDNSDQQLSIPQMATSIVRNTRLEGRFWYLAGVILSHILKTQREPLSAIHDEDIAIRAVFEGWPAVLKRYSLDRGWQWVKELDETLYPHLSPPERLMHMRNCRLQFLNQLYPNAGWDQYLPDFYAARPSQKYLAHDPLVEHFPWPAFRERLLFSPRKFATNKFMDALRQNLHFIWSYDAADLYRKNTHSGLYSFSDSFVRQLMDIRCYTAQPDFFEQFPELRQDIPFNDPSPFSILSAYSPTDMSWKVAQTKDADMESRRSSDASTISLASWRTPKEFYVPSRMRLLASP